MKISKQDISWAAEQASLSQEQQEKLWAALQQRDEGRPKFALAYVAYYFGALLVISAMGWFMSLGWESFGGGGIFALSVLYAVCFVLAGRHLWYEKGLKVPGGLLFTMAVCMTPLAVYGIERATGLWAAEAANSLRRHHEWCWIAIELSTIAAAVTTLRWVKFPFLVAPIAVSLWVMSIDLTLLLYGEDKFKMDELKVVSLYFGLVVLIVALVVDRFTKDDYAFWLYLFGLALFWGGLSLMDSDSEFKKFLYCMVNVLLIGIGVVLRRPVFAVFGGVGVFMYLGHLSYQVFKDSMLFPFALSLLGIAIIYLGVQFQKHRMAVEAAVLRMVPAGVKGLLPPDRS